MLTLKKQTINDLIGEVAFFCNSVYEHVNVKGHEDVFLRARCLPHRGCFQGSKCAPYSTFDVFQNKETSLTGCLCDRWSKEEFASWAKGMMGSSRRCFCRLPQSVCHIIHMLPHECFNSQLGATTSSSSSAPSSFQLTGGHGWLASTQKRKQVRTVCPSLEVPRENEEWTSNILSRLYECHLVALSNL